MKKILSILAMAGILFMAMSCKTGSDDDSGSKNSFPLNGTYVCKTKINGTDYTATMKLYDFENDEYYDEKTLGSDGFSGHITVKESPIPSVLLELDETEEFIIQLKASGLFEDYIKDRKENWGNGYEYDIQIRNLEQNTLDTDEKQIVEIAEINNPIFFNVRGKDLEHSWKRCTGENWYLAEKNNYNKIYIYTAAGNLLVFNKQ